MVSVILEVKIFLNKNKCLCASPSSQGAQLTLALTEQKNFSDTGFPICVHDSMYTTLQDLMPVFLLAPT